MNVLYLPGDICNDKNNKDGGPPKTCNQKCSDVWVPFMQVRTFSTFFIYMYLSPCCTGTMHSWSSAAHMHACAPPAFLTMGTMHTVWTAVYTTGISAGCLHDLLTCTTCVY
jgi:hypothetical protein